MLDSRNLVHLFSCISVEEGKMSKSEKGGEADKFVNLAHLTNFLSVTRGGGGNARELINDLRSPLKMSKQICPRLREFALAASGGKRWYS